MKPPESKAPDNDIKLGLLALVVFGADQLSKLAVLNYLGYAEEHSVVDGFFKLVHWGNTGAAWSMFRDSNGALAIVALVAFLALFLFRRKFDTHLTLGWVSIGLMFGGIAGNVMDRLMPSRQHVIDFLYFYVRRSNDLGQIVETGFPAFNVADSAICVGVFLLFILSWQKERRNNEAASQYAG